MPRTDARGLVIDGGNQPRILDHPRYARRKGRVPGIACLEPFHGPCQIGDKPCFTYFKMPEYFIQIGIRYFESFQQEVFDFDFIVGLRQTETGSKFHCFPAGIVEFPNQGFQVCFRHRHPPSGISGNRRT